MILKPPAQGTNKIREINLIKPRLGLNPYALVANGSQTGVHIPLGVHEKFPWGYMELLQNQNVGATSIVVSKQARLIEQGNECVAVCVLGSGEGREEAPLIKIGCQM